uniref:hypothetical protein n=1 Tax=Candidatus Fimenecus sp. TaxID=3022888 RepID=UPI003FF0526C
MAFLYSDTITASLHRPKKDFAFGSLCFKIPPKKPWQVTERLLLFGSEFMTGDTKERVLETALELFAQSERNAVN